MSELIPYDTGFHGLIQGEWYREDLGIQYNPSKGLPIDHEIVAKYLDENPQLKKAYLEGGVFYIDIKLEAKKHYLTSGKLKPSNYSWVTNEPDGGVK